MATCLDCIYRKVCPVSYPVDLHVCEDFKSEADFVEVVRCKDCQWATERTKDNELFQYQCRNTMACGKPRRDIDFCSYGERKEEK